MRKLKNSELIRKTIDEYKKAKKTPIVIVMDNIRSLNNIGSIFRTGDCFIVEKAILCGISAKPPHRDIHKTALGATESVDWEYFDKTEEAIDRLRSEGYQIISVEQTQDSVLLEEFTPEKGSSYALVFGHEVKGISQSVVDMSDYCIEIPQYGTKHSFNVSVSVGIVLWEISRKMAL